MLGTANPSLELVDPDLDDCLSNSLVVTPTSLGRGTLQDLTLHVVFIHTELYFSFLLMRCLLNIRAGADKQARVDTLSRVERQSGIQVKGPTHTKIWEKSTPINNVDKKGS